MSNPSGIEIQGTSTRTVTLAPGAERTINFDAEFYGTDTDRSVQFKLTTTEGQVIDSIRQRVTYTETVLSVQVVDSAGGPVEGAVVSLVSNAEATRTDVDGRVQVTSVTPGEHVVKVTPPRFAGGGQIATVDVAAGEETEATVRVERTGTVSGSVVNEKGEPLSGAVLSINGRTASVGSDGEFQFDGQFAAVTSYTVDVRRNSKSLYRSDIEVEPGANDVQLTVSDDKSGGWQLIDNANKGALLGEVGVQMGVSGSNTLEYHAGWLGLSMVPVADAPADIRDCLLAPNDDLATNALDCGGAGASTLGSVGTIIGAVTSPSGAGVAVAAGSFSLDTAEDIADAAKVAASAVKRVPDGASKIAELIVSKLGNQASKVVDQVKDADIANTLRKAIDKNRLQRAEFSSDEAAQLADAGVSVSKAKSLSKSGLDSETIVQLKRGDEVQIGRLSGWLENIQDVEGYDDLIEKINDGDVGALVEARVASKYESSNDFKNVQQIGKDITTSEGSTDIDVLLQDGTMVQVKRANYGELPKGKFDDVKSKYGTLIAKYRAYDSNAEIVFEFRDNVPPSVKKWLESEKGVTVRVTE
jgi:hypothetical protein